MGTTATRKGKGTHRAIWRAQYFLSQNRWFYKADILKFFDSIDQALLLDLIARKIKDVRVLALSERIIRNGGTAGKGLPIGNLTSQFFANVYLNPLDHFIKEKLRIKHYLRYMDDFVCFAQDKQTLKSQIKAIQGFLQESLLLTLKPEACFLNQANNGLSFLGMRIFARHIRPQNTHLRRISQKLLAKKSAWQKGLISEEDMIRSANSYFAHLSHYNTYQFRLQYLLDNA